MVRRFYAERYLLITVIGFSLSVSFTRLFLELTGYPQLGGSELHIAHILWGGLILFAGSLLPLIFANKRALDLSALLSGVGVGLFIDEIGKFLTRTNDYFYPAAAPIIYVFFLIILFLFTLIKRKNEPDQRSRLYHILEKFEEVLEGDLSQIEYKQMLTDLKNIWLYEEDSDTGRIAVNLIAVLQKEEENLVAHQLDFLEKIWESWLDFEKENFSRTEIKLWMLLVWLISGMLSIAHSIFSYLYTGGSITFSGLFGELFATSLVGFDQLSISAYIRFIGEAGFGFFLALSAALGFLHKRKDALNLAYIAQLANLVLVNIFVFYYDQFSAIVFTLFQFLVLFITLRYRRNFSPPDYP